MVFDACIDSVKWTQYKFPLNIRIRTLVSCDSKKCNFCIRMDKTYNSIAECIYDTQLPSEKCLEITEATKKGSIYIPYKSPSDCAYGCTKLKTHKVPGTPDHITSDDLDELSKLITEHYGFQSPFVLHSVRELAPLYCCNKVCILCDPSSYTFIDAEKFIKTPDPSKRYFLCADNSIICNACTRVPLCALKSSRHLQECITMYEQRDTSWDDDDF